MGEPTQTPVAPTPPLEGVLSLSVPFSKGSISVQIHVTGAPICPVHLELVRQYLEMAEREWWM